MTNKLPVVGKKYRHKTFGKVVEFVGDREDGFFIAAEKTLKHYAENYFLENFEELPEDKAETINCGNISCKYKSECDSNKRILPKNDQIYIRKTRYARITNVDSEGVTYLEQDGKEFWDCFKDFLDFFEPVEAETQPETQSHISELSPEVKEAMEELRREIALCGGGFNQSPQTELERKGMEIFYYFLSKSQNLLNALDKQFKVNETSESVDVKKEEVKEKIQPDENGSFKHIDGIEEETQDLMKKDIFGK